ncbi:hypothetical protein MMU07_16455 [Aquiflexum sp. LQ15W]|uniref:hypothetical protein n=1 Tax=Cognataquiflexum nitidum TaxID=2922272 RepID=UPI001F1316EB|nr:hypothetical protein [Cognataquiflexum nitidum]MCH6201179.1 hypothetical protein [Cognataquiflexum nitidum]
MKKSFQNISLLLLSLFFSFQSFAQVEIDIQEAAKSYYNAKMCDDYQTLLKFTYPDVIEKAGGPENVIKALELIHETQRKKGFVLQEFKSKPHIQLTETGEETHAIVPVTTISKVPGGKVITESHIIVVGVEENTRWYIIETTSLDDGNIKKVLASWDNTMLLPFKKAPIFKEDK